MLVYKLRNQHMPDFDTTRFSSPTAGMALTTEPGSRPWEKPAKYARGEDALNFYITELSDTRRLNSLFEILETNFPVTTFVDSIIITGVMQGLHTIDVGVLIAPALFQLVVGIADIAGVEYRSGINEEVQDSPTLITAAIKEGERERMSEEQPDELIEMADEGLVEIQKGLMVQPAPEPIEQGEE
jgi:hypothetical protein